MGSVSQDRMDDYKSQLLNSAATGALAGSLAALTTGYFILYKFNHGPNKKFFTTTTRLAYILLLSVAGLIFSTDAAKSRLRKQIFVENQLKRERYLMKELGTER